MQRRDEIKVNVSLSLSVAQVSASGLDLTFLPSFPHTTDPLTLINQFHMTQICRPEK